VRGTRFGQKRNRCAARRARRAEDDTKTALARAEKAERELHAVQERAGEDAELKSRADAAERELSSLRRDREDLRKRVAKMLELLESLE
jgi:hypothetical protein